MQSVTRKIIKLLIILNLVSCSTGKVIPVIEYRPIQEDQKTVVLLPGLSKKHENLISALNTHINNHNSLKIISHYSEIPENTKYVVGPIKFTDTSEAAAAFPNTKFFSLSNNLEIAGKNIYLIGIHPFDQIDTLLTYHSATGLDKIYIISPRSKFNASIIKYVVDSSDKYSFTITKIEQYTPSSFEYSINSIAANLKSSTDKEGLLILGNASDLKNTIEQLISHNVNINNFRIMGLNQYDELLDRPDNTELMHNIYFAGPYMPDGVTDKFLLYCLDGISIIEQIKSGKKPKDEFILPSGHASFSKHVLKRSLRIFKLGDQNSITYQ